MSSTKTTSSFNQSRPPSVKRPPSSSSGRRVPSSKHSDRELLHSAKHRSSSRSSAEHSRSSSRPRAAVTQSSNVKPTASHTIPVGRTLSSIPTTAGAPPDNTLATAPNPAPKPNGVAQGGAPSSIQPIGGSMRIAPKGMHDHSAVSGYGGMDSMGGNQNGMSSGYGSMGGAQNTMDGFGFMGPCYTNGYGSMGGNQMGMPSDFGPMCGGQNGMGGYGSMAGGGPGSMDGMGGPMDSMYGMGGPICSMYGMGGPMGSMYGPASLMGSMYGMGAPMGSMYGMGGPMGSMLGPMGSMYGMGGMGSLYGMGGGSLYGGGYHSVVDMASRRGSFLNKNDLIRADVKPLNSNKDNGGGKDAKEADDKERSKKDGKSREIKLEEPKTDSKDPKATEKKEATDKKGSADKKLSTEAKLVDKKDANEVDKRIVKGKDGEKEDGEKEDSERKDSEKKDGEKKDGEAPVAKPDGLLKFSGTKIRSLALVYKSGKEAKVTRKGVDTVIMDGKETKLDEVIFIEDPKKPVEAAALSEVRNQWVSGHNATIMIGSDGTRRTQAVDFMREYLSTCTGKLAASGEYFSIYLTMTALEGADQGRDLLKDAATFEKLTLASSPVYGPALNNMTIKEVNTKETMEEVLKEGMERAKEGEVVCSYLVLKQCRKSSAGAMVYLSSLNVTHVGPNVEHLTGLKAKKPEEPCRLYRYSVGGGSHTMCVGFVSDDDASAAKVFDALKEMREVQNTEPRSGNVKRFIEYTKKEIPKCKEKVASSTEESKKANYETMLKRMEMMLKDAEDIEKDAKAVAPKAYV
ncbi:hypothetical protein LPMP_333080 [Leishmania panamensis]|uniref:Nucleoside triphosphate hydrolase, putative n=1 Tax=Leishmania panamensis TaxID=5679 RepID=A0A088RZM3_LEIPA|nr:hypothetical protein LPMP_333080 [Leishmania panamensis]AIO01598.1 hypothetical protein LPMP_333080 [Leishmania panamensis]